MEEKKEQQEESNYSFLKQTIKREGLKSKEGRRKLALLAFKSFFIGSCACVGFFALCPWAQNHFQGEPKEVAIPCEENDEEQSNQTLLENKDSRILDGASYQEFLNQVDMVAERAQKTIVSVKATEEEVKDTSLENEATKSQTGVVIADNGQELLILTSSDLVSEHMDLTVTFCDHTEYAAALKKQDRKIGIAVLSISRNEISSATWSQISIATLGNSRVVYQGDLVLALGNVFGYSRGQGYGVISSTEYKAKLCDGIFRILATDISSSEKGNGVLFNLEGEVVGIIMPHIWEGESGLLANAYAISDIKTEIELLSNGSSVPYVGVYGTYITEELAEEQKIPKGLYVNQVAADSPALNTGIQSGDVIEQVGDTKITSLESFERVVLGKTVGGSVKIKGQRRGNNGYVDIDFTMKIGSLE